jgi:16S rRNA (cytosine967-C5)-methyltransferase
MTPTTSARQTAFQVLRDIDRKGSYADSALDRILQKSDLQQSDRRLVTELVYGVIRRQRTLDHLIEQFSQKNNQKQPPDLRRILQIGLYQLRYLDQIPASAAVNTSVDLAKANGLKGLAGVVNGILRSYLRIQATQGDPLILPIDPIQKLGIFYSFPDWLIQLFREQWDEQNTAELCQYFNQPPPIDLRINPLKTDLETVEQALAQVTVETQRLAGLPQALRLIKGERTIQNLPGFRDGWWTVQDASAQLVSHILNPQPQDLIIDGCAAPGGKTTHLAELMGDRGTIYACDLTASRLKKLEKSQQRLQLRSIYPWIGDSRKFQLPEGQLADKVLVDAPCSGLGTLHRNPDIRWRQTPDKIQSLTLLQAEILEQAATWVKPQGDLVYATCTLNPQENQAIIQQFLQTHLQWHLSPLPVLSLAKKIASEEGWLQILPQVQHMDGFFIAKLKKA